VRSVTPSDREAALELARRAFGREHVTPDAARRWDWIFVNNTSGTRMHYALADAGTRLAGQYAMMPVRLQHQGKPTFGLLSLDTATDPDFAFSETPAYLGRAVAALAADPDVLSKTGRARVEQELARRRFAAPAYTRRQLRRIVYG